MSLFLYALLVLLLVYKITGPPRNRELGKGNQEYEQNSSKYFKKIVWHQIVLPHSWARNLNVGGFI